ncbi:ras-related and estrogen-regulated growth inhibitor-like isoform X1 [Formica exsecta]|uniref:ras-related and estrogen-regulated growth inhibitor-like isoform X1 n=2 Tax=Formica exsecta TaxID=72781 RepID=UPI00114233A7|nr:ras-related and estrogen-regulated growth inhibitor-like isoform X1 [Formica exsecta]
MREIGTWKIILKKLHLSSTMKFVVFIIALAMQCVSTKSYNGYDRAKPVLLRIVNWFFGGCPEASRRHREQIDEVGKEEIFKSTNTRKDGASRRFGDINRFESRPSSARTSVPEADTALTNAHSMTSNAIRGIRRKKSSLCEVKVAVIGAPGVGKSALTVRFLTRRYIGEYDHQSETRYKHEVLVDGEPILFEILDTCPKSEDELPSMETLQWADGLLLVYSITDRNSFNFVRKAKEALAVADPEAAMPLALVGNKADMVHLRQVSGEEGEILAKDFECWFSEITAAEQVAQVAESFHELCREVLAARRRNKQSLLDRMLGSKATRAYSRGKSDSALPKE